MTKPDNQSTETIVNLPSLFCKHFFAFSIHPEGKIILFYLQYPWAAHVHRSDQFGPTYEAKFGVSRGCASH